MTDESLTEKPMKVLTDQNILEAFSDHIPIITSKIRESKNDRKSLIEEITISLNLSRGYDEVTQEVWNEFVKIEYGTKLDEIDKHLWRLKTLKTLFLGEAHPPNKITPALIERAKTVPIESLSDRVVRRAGRLNRGLCPFHEERTPSFYIYPDNSFWCFGCCKGGDAISFAQLQFGHSFQDAVRFLVARAV